MDDRTIELVRRSFDAVMSVHPDLVADFYRRLFVAHPDLRALFPTSLERQTNKLAATLQIAISLLDDPDALVPALRELGRLHAGLGAQEDQYHCVAEVLLDTLAARCGPDWTDEVATAWRAVLAFVTAQMIIGARTATP